MDIPQELIDQVEAVAAELHALAGVTGVGIGMREEDEQFFDELAVRILVADLNDLPAGLPETVADLPVCIVEFPVEPLFAPDDKRYDELIGGIRAEQAPNAGGTLGTLVLDADSNVIGLTNHHVAGDVGTTVWQPIAPPAVIGSPPDPTDSLGNVIACASPATQTIPVPTPDGLALGRPLDAATFSLDAATDPTIGNRTLAAGVTGYGEVDGTESPTVGIFIRKRGSKSGPTAGQVVGLQLVTDWRVGTPPPGHKYVINHQYELFYDPSQCPDGIISAGGDSGSLVLRQDNQNAVGLLWGGIREGGRRALMSDITVVEAELGITVAWSF